jgi:hypothetical protein
MNTDARELMADLRDDHRKMSMVLNLLADQVEAMEADEDPDFELLDEIMRYMTRMPCITPRRTSFTSSFANGGRISRKT